MFFAPLFTVFFAALSVLAAPSATASVSFDQVFDNANGDLHTVSCSDGPNGLLTKGFTTFGSLPNFPNIGGAAAVAGFNSPNCGACFQLTFNGTSINVLAIDHASPGFNIGLKAMNKLTNNQGEFLGRINAQFSQVNASACGL